MASQTLILGLAFLALSACANSPQSGTIGETERRARWVLISQNEDGTSLNLAFEEGNSCAMLDRVDVEETNNTVEIHVVVLQREAAEGEACQDFLRIARTTAQLREPLGSRTLVGECKDPDCDALKGRPLGQSLCPSRTLSRAPKC